MFMEAGSSKALKKYLIIKMDEFDAPSKRLQFTMALAWLVEIIISSISTLEALDGDDKEEIDELYLELDQLLDDEQVVECIKSQKRFFYDILRNYFNPDTFIRVASRLGDYEQVVKCHIESENYQLALDVIKTTERNDLFNTYGHIMMKWKAKEFVDALIEQKIEIQPSKLIPILIQENPYYNKCSETIRYLEHCVKILKTNSRMIHNYLFELYARHCDEDTLINYLENEISLDGGQQYYLDLQLCLRLCNELKMVRVCVVLYSYMGYYDEAVNLALDFDVELAKSIAKKVDSEDHQKKLWLLIAGDLLNKDADIRVATSLLRESRLLRIEDILPFFPDLRTIDCFKDAIIRSMQEYRNQMMALKDGTYDDIADEIGSEIKSFRSRYSIVKVGQRCEICSKSILARTFYVFPCGHLFHGDCIVKEVNAIDPRLNLVDTNQKVQKSIGTDECVYCGGLLASYIDKPAPIGNDPTLSELY